MFRFTSPFVGLIDVEEWDAEDNEGTVFDIESSTIDKTAENRMVKEMQQIMRKKTA
jgi:hypothetical protein